ncbi:MAG: polysaccharide pyruvyl transferase family protein [Chloroflexota bacterium]
MLKMPHIGMTYLRYKNQIDERFKTLNRLIGLEDVAIFGSFNTTNVGDLAIGNSLKYALKKKNISASLYGLNHSNFARYSLAFRGGGDSLHDRNSKVLERLLAVANHGSLGLAGVGVPGFVTVTGMKLVREVVESAKFVTVRDHGSYERLIDVLPDVLIPKIKVSADPVFLLANSTRWKTLPRRSGLVGVAARPVLTKLDKWAMEKLNWSENDITERASNYLATLRQTINFFQDQGQEVLFIPFEAEDVFFYQRELADMKIRIAKYEPDPFKVMSTVSSMEAMICVRYHSIIFSMLTDTPMHVISYADKCDSLLDKLPHISSTDRKSMYEFREPNLSYEPHKTRAVTNSLSQATQITIESIVSVL